MTRTANPFPWGVASALVLVVAVEATLARRSDAFVDWLTFTWRDAARSVQRPELQRAEVLSVGDSLVKEGVLPNVLEARLGRPCYNLAAHGGPAPATYFLFRDALRSGARPRVVVVDYHPNLLAVTPKSSEVGWSEVASPVDLFDLAWTTHDPGFVLSAAGSFLLPSLRVRVGVRGAILAGFRGEERPERSRIRALARNFRVNQGAWVASVVPPLVNPERLLLNLPDFGPWKPDPSNVAYIRKFLTLAGQSGATVVWLLPPTSPAWQSRRESIGADARYCDLVRTMQAEFPGLVIADGRHAAYPQSAFHDLTHLHVQGAWELSESLAEVIAPYLERVSTRDRPAWFALPRYRGRPNVGPIEDMERSRLAVSTEGTLRR